MPSFCLISLSDGTINQQDRNCVLSVTDKSITVPWEESLPAIYTYLCLLTRSYQNNKHYPSHIKSTFKYLAENITEALHGENVYGSIRKTDMETI